jgi:hypothetical protein
VKRKEEKKEIVIDGDGCHFMKVREIEHMFDRLIRQDAQHENLFLDDVLLSIQCLIDYFHVVGCNYDEKRGILRCMKKIAILHQH